MALRGDGRGQAGLTLMEVLISVVLMSIVVIGLISGLFTMIRASGTNENLQRVEAALVSFGNSVKVMPYRECQHEPDTSSAHLIYDQEYKQPWLGRWAPAASSGLSLQNDLKIIAVDYWNPTPNPVDPTGWQSFCPGTDHGIQRLTLQVTYRDESSTAQIVKRRPVEQNP